MPWNLALMRTSIPRMVSFFVIWPKSKFQQSKMADGRYFKNLFFGHIRYTCAKFHHDLWRWSCYILLTRYCGFLQLCTAKAPWPTFTHNVYDAVSRNDELFDGQKTENYIRLYLFPKTAILGAILTGLGKFSCENRFTGGCSRVNIKLPLIVIVVQWKLYIWVDKSGSLIPKTWFLSDNPSLL